MHRLTISLDDELYAMARAYALANRKSISKAIGDLMRPNPYPVSSPSASSAASFSIDPVTQLPVVRGKAGKISLDDIRHAQEDEDLRYLEGMVTARSRIPGWRSLRDAREANWPPSMKHCMCSGPNPHY